MMWKPVGISLSVLLQTGRRISHGIIFTHESEDGAGVYDGYPGIIVQCCVAEIRKVAVRKTKRQMNRWR